MKANEKKREKLMKADEKKREKLRHDSTLVQHAVRVPLPIGRSRI
jgi:hypothetical protein